MDEILIAILILFVMGLTFVATILFIAIGFLIGYVSVLKSKTY